MQMRVFVASLLVAACNALSVLPERSRGGKLAELVPEWKTQYGEGAALTYEAPLDHFNGSVSGTVRVRYWIDDSCHQQGGPVFVNMGGEGGAGPAVCNSRARQHKAVVVNVEHRFYGQSLPHSAAPLALEYLKYLTVEQNLADTNNITRAVMQKYSATKAFAFGGSYSGATCAWYRQKYPNTVAGCLSSSGVVNAIYEFTAFDTRIYKAISHPDAACPQNMMKLTAALESAFKAGNGAKVKEQYNAKNLVGTKYGDSDFFYAVADALAQLDQYGQKAALCQGFHSLSPDATDEERIANGNKIIAEHYGASFVGQCFYDSECLKRTVTAGDMARQWRWQKCTEVAYLQNAPKQDSLRSTTYLTLPDLIDQCAYVFGLQPSYMSQVNQDFNKKFWSKLPTEATQVFFLDFSDDPWQEASVNKTLAPTLPYCMTTCDGCGHCGAGSGVHAAACNNEADKYITQWLA